MVKQWKKSLEQGDILSDGKPFDGANIDAPISSAGTTQETIADGTDESDGRWQMIYSGGVGGSQPDEITTEGTGATPQFGTGGVTMSSNSSGDNGRVIVFASTAGGSIGWGDFNGTLLLKFMYYSEVSIGSLSDSHILGLSLEGFSNEALFRPAVGNNTSGNIRVSNGGTDYDESISYPNIDQPNTYTVLIDWSGSYISAGNTGFYINSDPRKGDAPTAKINQVPDPTSGASRAAGAAYESKGNNQEMNIQYMEAAWRQP